MSYLRYRDNVLHADGNLNSGTRRHALFAPGTTHSRLRASPQLDGFSDPYNHMLHYNQVMILNAGNDLLLCKVFSASLRGFTLIWFHKLPCNSINSFNELWAAFVSQYLCSVRQKRNISSLQTILKQEIESIRDFTMRFEQAVQKIESYSMDAIL